MVPSLCKSCGSLNFYEEESKYVCTYCKSTVLKEQNKVTNNTFIIKENKYVYAFIVSIVFLAYILYTQLVKTNDTLILNTPQKVVYKEVPRAVAKWSMLSKSATGKVYQNISTDKDKKIFTLCYKNKKGSFEVSRDKYGDTSKPVKKACIPNTQSTLQQEDGYIKATSINVNGQSDIKLTKYDTNNNKIWETSFGSIHDDTLTHIVPGLDGYVLLAGTSKSKSKNYAWVFQVYDDVSRTYITILNTPVRFWKE